MVIQVGHEEALNSDNGNRCREQHMCSVYSHLVEMKALSYNLEMERKGRKGVNNSHYLDFCPSSLS